MEFTSTRLAAVGAFERHGKERAHEVHMVRILYALMVSAVLTGPLGAYAQWVPVTARLKQTREVLAQDRSLERTVKTGRYYRASNGSTLRQWQEMNGRPLGNPTGELSDNKSGRTYWIDYAAKRATVRAEGGPNLPRAYDAEKLRGKSIGQDSVGGLSCAIVPLWDGNSGRQIGQVCIALEYDLVLRLESANTRSDGTTLRITNELEDVELNAEPDAALFDLKQFTLEK